MTLAPDMAPSGGLAGAAGSTSPGKLTDLFQLGLDAPICLTWELTYACNLSCVHCLSSSGRRDPRELSTDECKAVIDTLERMQVFYVNIGGGEPTVRPDFWELVDYATAHHVGVKFSTNGVRLDAAAAARLAASDYVDVQISLDGATREVNDAIRGPGSFDTAMRAMGNLRAAGFRGFKLSVVMTRQNIPQIDAFKAIADEYGAQLRLTRLRPSGRGADVWDELHPLPEQQKELYDWLVAHGEQVLTGDSFFHLSAFGGALPGLNLCGAGRVVCLIDPVGDVYACPFAIHENFLAGNVRASGGFESVWRESALFADLRKPDTGGACKSCGFYDSCRGGCMAAKFFTGLPLDGPDPECVQGYGETALASVAASPGLPVPRPSVDHSHRTAPRGGSAGAGAKGGPVPVTIAVRRPPSHDCDESPLAGFDARPDGGAAARPGVTRHPLSAVTDGCLPLSGQAAPDGPPGQRSAGVKPPPAPVVSGAAPVPAGLRLRPDSGTRLVAGGSVLVGGSPVRVLRLTRAGARQVASWFSGTPVPAGTAARTLARRLLDAGVAHPNFGEPGPGCPDLAAQQGDADVPPEAPRAPQPADVTVVIPVRDRHAELDRCLSGLRAPGPAAVPPACGSRGHRQDTTPPGDERSAPRVIVVDDASADPAAIAAIAARHGAAVIHRPVNGGPGAARNTGLAAAATDLVAFLDSDCVPRPGWLDRLLPHFADPAVGAVAPRIVPHQAGTGWLARYEGASSTLDMGARPSIVRPGARVSYVPGAALVVRRPAAGDGFRDGMYVGEDVDFVWRLGAAGWRVRYEPAATMGHDHRVAFRAWFARRTDYGTSAAALEDLHPGAVRPLYASWWTAGAWTAALAGRPVTAVALTATATALLARRLSRVTGERWPFPARASVPATARRESAGWELAIRLAGGGTLAAGRPIGSALSRTWWPVAIPAALAVRKLRLPVAALILAPPLLDWADRRPPLDPARYVAARLLDDAAYSVGVWQGCVERRTVRPLLPVIGGKRQPG